MAINIFVDGAHGVVGSRFIDQLMDTDLNYNLLTVPEHTYDESTRADQMKKADVVVLCLPDEAALRAASLVMDTNPRAKIIDASAAHRCAPGWVYGLPEVLPTPCPTRGAQYVANPGCFATGAVLIAKPLELGRFTPVAFTGVTGRSAAGKSSNAVINGYTQVGSDHRHLPEIRMYGDCFPSLAAFVGSWHQGMIVQATFDILSYDAEDKFYEYYASHPAIKVSVMQSGRVHHDQCNISNLVDIIISHNSNDTTTVFAVLDNLGRGSVGALISNLYSMLELQYVG